MDNFFELEQTQFLQSLALAVLKIPYAGYLLSDKRSNFIDYVSCTKNLTLIYVFEDKRCYKGMPIFYKKKVHFVDTISRRTYFLDKDVPFGSENNHNAVQLNSDEDKYSHPILRDYATIKEAFTRKYQSDCS